MDARTHQKLENQAKLWGIMVGIGWLVLVQTVFGIFNQMDLNKDQMAINQIFNIFFSLFCLPCGWLTWRFRHDDIPRVDIHYVSLQDLSPACATYSLVRQGDVIHVGGLSISLLETLGSDMLSRYSISIQYESSSRGITDTVFGKDGNYKDPKITHFPIIPIIDGISMHIRRGSLCEYEVAIIGRPPMHDVTPRPTLIVDNSRTG